MLEFPYVTPQDLKIAASIEHKRRNEEARKMRIFNPRARRIGIDKEFLDKQVEEKKQRINREKTKEDHMDAQLVRSSRLAEILQRREEEERRKIEKKINAFRTEYQRAEDRRDYDLYDPDGLKKSAAAPLKDEEARFGLASAQKFAGEDENAEERSKLSKELMHSWLDKQKLERRAAENARKQAEEAYQNAVIARDRRAVMLDRMEEECRRKLNEATSRFNRLLAEEQKYRKKCEAIREEEDKRADIFNHVTGDFLTEAREQAESNKGPNKPLASRYKGMSDAELTNYRDEQTRQMEEILRTKREEKFRDEEWDRQMSGNARAAKLYERDLERKRREISRQIAEQNLRLAEEQKSRQRHLNRNVYKNEPLPEFFEQFNKSTR